MTKRSGFGSVRRLPSKRWQARYTGPDGRPYTARSTFDTKRDAEAALAKVRTEISQDLWRPPADAVAQTGALLFGEYAETWLQTRTVRGRHLAERTEAHYRGLLKTHINPTFNDTPLRFITRAHVEEWYAKTVPNRPTLQGHAYSLLRTILGTAAERGIIPVNPAHIRGAGSVTRAKKIRPASIKELEAITAAMPAHYQCMVLLASWCALRQGELFELRRSDVDVKAGILRIRRGVVRAGGKIVVKAPKSEAGVRDVAIPPHLMVAIKAHLRDHVGDSPDSLLFPARSGGHLAPSSLYRVYYPARDAAKRSDLRFHDLRHSGAVLAAQTGATLAELMSRLGHSTPAAAMRYQHAASERDAEIAKRLSAMAVTKSL